MEAMGRLQAARAESDDGTKKNDGGSKGAGGHRVAMRAREIEWIRGVVASVMHGH